MIDLEKICDELYNKFTTRLHENENSPGALVERTNSAILICSDFLDQLKALINRHTFLTKTEEARFFKQIKPRFSSWFIYYSGILKLHTRWPSGNRQIHKEHLHAATQKIAKFFRSNKSLYEYYRAGHSHLDEQYFVRSHNNPRLFSGFVFNDIDRTFCTSHDNKIARILAYDMLEKYLQNRLDEIENGIPEAPVNNDFTWDYQKNAFVELVYSLKEIQPFQRKQLSIKEIAAHLGKIWNINVDDEIYRIFHEMCRRKTGRTKFLDLLRVKLLKRMDEDPE